MTSTNFKKHTSKNPLQRYLIDRFTGALCDMARLSEAHTVLDAGCGEGFTLDTLKKTGIGRVHTGIDASGEALTEGKRMFPELDMRYGDIFRMNFDDRAFDLVICSEVLEHLKNPETALREIRRVSGNYVLLTVPWEPWFWITNFFLGKYRSTWGNHPEHVNHWTYRGFKRFVGAQGLTIVRSVISYPWILILARTKT